MPTYAYRGNKNFIDAVEERLAQAGFQREGEVEIADIVLTFCTNMTQLEDLYFGDGGLMQILKPGTVALDVSAATPGLATELGGVAAVSNVHMVSAPLVVKNKLAECVFANANLACFAGSEDGDIGIARDVLDVLFGDVREVAGAGAAQLARAASTVQNTAEMVAAIETMALFKACSDSVADINVKEIVPDATSPDAYFIMKAIRGGQFESDYTVEMLMGELSAALMTADDYDMIMPQTEAAFHLYELLAIIGGSDLSPSALSLVYDGDKNEHAKDVGIDWKRAEQMYGSDSAEADAYDDQDDYDEDLFGFDPDDEDDLAKGFGYSVN